MWAYRGGPRTGALVVARVVCAGKGVGFRPQIKSGATGGERGGGGEAGEAGCNDGAVHVEIPAASAGMTEEGVARV